MKKVLLILLFLPLILNGQYLGVFTKYYTLKELSDRYNKNCKKNNYRCEIKAENDTLKIEVFGSEHIIVNFAFDSINHHCDYQDIIFFCNNCINKHIKDFKEMSLYHWKKIDENKYLSNYFLQTEVQIDRNGSSDKCLKMKFFLIKKHRKEYRKYYKSFN
jgi:hypothetical protein